MRRGDVVAILWVVGSGVTLGLLDRGLFGSLLVWSWHRMVADIVTWMLGCGFGMIVALTRVQR